MLLGVATDHGIDLESRHVVIERVDLCDLQDDRIQESTVSLLRKASAVAFVDCMAICWQD